MFWSEPLSEAMGKVLDGLQRPMWTYELTELIEPEFSPGCTPGPRSPDSSLMLGRPALSSGITLSELRGCASGGIRRFETGLLG